MKTSNKWTNSKGILQKNNRSTHNKSSIKAQQNIYYEIDLEMRFAKTTCCVDKKKKMLW